MITVSTWRNIKRKFNFTEKAVNELCQFAITAGLFEMPCVMSDSASISVKGVPFRWIVSVHTLPNTVSLSLRLIKASLHPTLQEVAKREQRRKDLGLRDGLGVKVEEGVVQKGGEEESQSPLMPLQETRTAPKLPLGDQPPIPTS